MAPRIYRLSGAINPRGRSPAVCVPTFGTDHDNSTYVQYVGIDNTALTFEIIEENEWEPIRGIPPNHLILEGKPALHWITWNETFDDILIGTVESVRSSVLERRFQIDQIENPFEQLDFAQLAGHLNWFSEVVDNCRSSFAGPGDFKLWVRETLLLSRIRYAIDSVAVSLAMPRALRLRLASAVNLQNTDINEISMQNTLLNACGSYLPHNELLRIVKLLNQDLAYRYVRAHHISADIDGHSLSGKSRSIMWVKQLTASDAQRKPSGNQRGSITLVKSRQPIDAQTYFRHELFSEADWSVRPAKYDSDMEACKIRCKTNVLGRDLGYLEFMITYAPKRQAAQSNYTTLLHIGPLTALFNEIDMSGKWLAVSSAEDNEYMLAISDGEDEVRSIINDRHFASTKISRSVQE